jgi:hypothetical protein
MSAGSGKDDIAAARAAATQVKPEQMLAAALQAAQQFEVRHHLFTHDCSPNLRPNDCPWQGMPTRRANL